MWNEMDNKIRFCNAVCSVIQKVKENRSEEEILVELNTNDLATVNDSEKAISSLSSKLISVAESVEIANCGLEKRSFHDAKALVKILQATGAQFQVVVPLVELKDFHEEYLPWSQTHPSTRHTEPLEHVLVGSSGKVQSAQTLTASLH